MIALRVKLILGIMAVVAFLILLSLTQEMNRRWQVQREVDQLELEARELEKNVIELENLNQYFRTDDYQERLAREKLNYRAEGEKVVLIPEDDVSREDFPQEKKVEEETAVPWRWWKIFFVDSASTTTEEAA